MSNSIVFKTQSFDFDDEEGGTGTAFYEVERDMQIGNSVTPGYTTIMVLTKPFDDSYPMKIFPKKSDAIKWCEDEFEAAIARMK